MRHRSGRKIRVAFLIFAVLLIAAILIFQLELSPLMKDLAVTQVKNEASDAISDAVNEQIANGNIEYDKIITMEKNSSGQITALKTNMSQINQLRREILSLVNQRVLDLNIYELGLPVGNILLPSILSGWGPQIPVYVASVNNAGAEFQSSFSEAGINQTLHRIVMQVSMDVTILVAGGTKTATITQDVVVAETVIVGVVPDSFLNVGT